MPVEKQQQTLVYAAFERSVEIQRGGGINPDLAVYQPCTFNYQIYRKYVYTSVIHVIILKLGVHKEAKIMKIYKF